MYNLRPQRYCMVFLPMSARQNRDGTLGLLKGALRGWHLLGDFSTHTLFMKYSIW